MGKRRVAALGRGEHPSSPAPCGSPSSATVSRERYAAGGARTYRLKVGPVSREFVVSEGTVRYFGTPDQDAALDIKAKHVVIRWVSPRTSRWWRISAAPSWSRRHPRSGEIRSVADRNHRPDAVRQTDRGIGRRPGIANQAAVVQRPWRSCRAKSSRPSCRAACRWTTSRSVPARRAGRGGRPLEVAWAPARSQDVPVVNAVLRGRPVGRAEHARPVRCSSASARSGARSELAPVQTCNIDTPGTQGITVPRQVGSDLFWRSATDHGSRTADRQPSGGAHRGRARHHGPGYAAVAAGQSRWLATASGGRCAPLRREAHAQGSTRSSATGATVRRWRSPLAP